MDPVVPTNPHPRQLAFDDTATAFAAQSDKALRKKWLVFASMNNNLLTKTGTAVLKAAFKLRLPINKLVKHTVFEQFCGGETIEESEATVQELAHFGIKTILDYSVEGEKTEQGFDATTAEILRTVAKAKNSPHIPFCVFKVTGIGAFELLEKVQRKEKLSAQETAAFERVRSRVDQICKATAEAGVRVFIDGEETWIQDTIDELAYDMMRKYNQQAPVVYNTYQLYRADGLRLLQDAMHMATMHNIWLGAKLVRGAYMEKERERAQELGYPDPINPGKQATDDLYNKALKFCLDNKQRIGLCSGSHNEYSNQLLTVLMQKHSVQPTDPNFYFAQLYGMSDNLSFTLAAAGYNVVKYVPYGPVEKVMPYLFRRAQENTSVAGQSSREFTLIEKEMKRRGIRLL
ncbi:proline dehydrogenase family protein [Cesiribacter andamanensis]|uniref:Proline dehydrogenase 1 n=1 Tax=Cesiribacter andamanensis AMV16 TaxID=1279009 RepID=M7N0T9_9BACT|nr:proline dehydrogenase family protein [Cesiribacter andamanensis]EMR02278.1 Proline dehydrogenase 1 [Cesiribacter andamanensis AMV16]